MKRSEKVLLVVVLLILTLWVTSEWNKLDATLVALIGVGLMILTGVINWEDVLAEKGAWDALIWLRGLVMMATGLNQLGFMKWVADPVAGSVAGLAWLPALIVLALVYFYSHYGFASVTTKVTAMFPPSLAIALAAKAPPPLTVLLFGICSALGAEITHYGTGPSPIYYNSGYVDLGTWWKLGLLVSIVVSLSGSAWASPGGRSWDSGKGGSTSIISNKNRQNGAQFAEEIFRQIPGKFLLDCRGIKEYFLVVCWSLL